MKELQDDMSHTERPLVQQESPLAVKPKVRDVAIRELNMAVFSLKDNLTRMCDKSWKRKRMASYDKMKEACELFLKGHIDISILIEILVQEGRERNLKVITADLKRLSNEVELEAAELKKEAGSLVAKCIPSESENWKTGLNLGARAGLDLRMMVGKEAKRNLHSDFYLAGTDLKRKMLRSPDDFREVFDNIVAGQVVDNLWVSGMANAQLINSNSLADPEAIKLLAVKGAADDRITRLMQVKASMTSLPKINITTQNVNVGKYQQVNGVPDRNEKEAV